MQLQHINIENLKTANINVRKKGAKDIDNLLPSIRSLGLLQPLLVRPKTLSAECEGYEIIAGQRRYHALMKLADEGVSEPVPCIIMEKDDDAKAIEASLAENVARLPMDEIDQYKAFSALIKQEMSTCDIANQFGITERLVQQRLAIANLINPILTLYTREEIAPDTLRILTMASKRQQSAWLKLFKSDEEYAPEGYQLKRWLFGGENIKTENALFGLDEYQGSIISDLFGEDEYFGNAEKFWELQNTAIADAKEKYLAESWEDVTILDVGEYFPSYEYVDTAKEDGGKIFIVIANSGEVTFYEGQLLRKELEAKRKSASGEQIPTTPKAELTKAMHNYLDLHRHASVRAELLNHQGIALRLAVAQVIAGAELWQIHADPQKANSDAIKQSLTTNKAEDKFANERDIICKLLAGLIDDNATIVPAKKDWQRHNDLYGIFAKLIELDDENVTRIMTFVIAETLPCGSATVEILGNLLSVEATDDWQVDGVFFDLLRDKEAINAILKQVRGKVTADAHISSTAKVQKQIIRDYLDGTRKGGKKDCGHVRWHPRYMDFPMRNYTKRGGLSAIANWNSVKKIFA